MKKLLLLLLALCLVIPVIALTACGDDSDTPTPGPTHTHSYWDYWSYDDDKHWKDADCGHDEIKDEANHVDSDMNDICDVCGYALPAHSITYDEKYTRTEDGHYKATTCCQNHEVKVEPHKDEDHNGLCDICGYGEEIIPKVYKTITLKANVGGQLREVDEIKVEVDTKLTEEQIAAIKDATYRGRGFAEWYLDNTLKDKFDYDVTVSDNIVLYGDVGDLAGKAIVWSYDADTKTLTLEGEGDMFDFTSQTVLPWFGYQVNKVVIDQDITSIGGYTFYKTDGMNISSITLHEGITYIGGYAFYGQTALTEVVFPESLEVIGGDAFRACTGLTYIDIGGSNLEFVDEGAFAECSGAKYIVFNDAIDSSAQVFESCVFTHAYFVGNKAQYESVKIGFGNKVFDTAYLFYYTSYEPVIAGPYWHRAEDGSPAQWCYSINYYNSDGSTVPIAHDYVFVKNPVITQENIDFRDNIWFRGYQFDSWTGTDTLALGATINRDIKLTGVRSSKVGDGVDYSVSGSTLYITGSGKMWDFETVIAAPWNEDKNTDTTVITEIIIGSNVTYIGDYAFCNFPSLESIEIKSNIVEMSTKAFFGCKNLKYVYYYGNELEAMNCKGLKNQEEAPNLIVYCQEFEGNDVSFLTAKGVVPTISYWKDIVIEAAIEDAEGNVIQEAKTTRVTWEYADGVLTVGGEGPIIDYAEAYNTPWGTTFYYINEEPELDFDELEESVTKIVIREGITSIGNNAFNGLYKVESIVIPDSVKRISASAFVKTAFVDNKENYDEHGLLIINNDLIKVDPDKAGTRVLIPDNIVTIAEGAFADCSNVTEIRVPNLLSGASEKSYEGLTALETIYLNATAAGWANNVTKDALPKDAELYFFSASMPTSFGNHWYNLSDPHIWNYWIEKDGDAAVGNTTVTVTAAEIANGCVNYVFTSTDAGVYTIKVEGATVSVYEIDGYQVREMTTEDWMPIPNTYKLNAETQYSIIVNVSDLEAGDYTIVIGYTAPEAEETPAD